MENERIQDNTTAIVGGALNPVREWEWENFFRRRSFRCGWGMVVVEREKVVMSALGENIGSSVSRGLRRCNAVLIVELFVSVRS